MAPDYSTLQRGGVLILMWLKSCRERQERGLNLFF
jgi:hypothetical protein